MRVTKEKNINKHLTENFETLIRKKESNVNKISICLDLFFCFTFF